MHNIVDNLKLEQALMPQTITTTALTSGNLDMLGVETLAVAVMVGNISETLSASAKVDLKIEHADDNGSGAPGTYVACTDMDVANFANLSSGLFLSINDNTKEQKRYVVEYRGAKRFVKITATPTGLTTGGAIAMLSLKGNVSQKPVSNS